MTLIRYLFLLSVINNSYGFSYGYIQLKTKFNNIPINDGIRHIHSLEHISDTHKLGTPFFKIISVKEPNPTIPSINFTCSIMNLYKIDVMTISKYTNRCEMTFYLLQKEFLTLQMTVIPDLQDDKSHYFFMKFLPSFDMTFIKPILEIFLHISMFISKREDINYFFHKNKINHLPKFNKYRKFIHKKL